MIKGFRDNTVLVITGPTASGKSSLAHSIALNCSGEVIVADSMKVYRGADILTAKPRPKYIKEVKYHLMDIIDPADRFDAGKFYRMACSVIDSLLEEGKLPVVAGGTPLYITSLMEGIADIPPLEANIKKRLSSEPTEKLYRLLKEKDPERARRLHPNMRKRIIRALGVVIQTGEKMSLLLGKTEPPDYDFVPMHIHWEREELYSRINRRVDRMVQEGIRAETEKLLSACNCRAAVFEGLGYKEMISHIKGDISFEQAVEDIKQATRNYARRQLTWWRNRKIIRLRGKELKKMGVIN